MSDVPTSNADRFLELVKPLEGQLEAYGRRLIWETQELPDAIQNALLKAYRAFDRYHEQGTFRAWMLRILTHEIFALNRRHARAAKFEFQMEPEELEDLAGPEPAAPSATPQSIEDWLEPDLALALRTLTDQERAVLLLRAISDLRYREIATALDVPIGSVMAYLSRARQKMRVAMTRLHHSPNSKPKTHL